MNIERLAQYDDNKGLTMREAIEQANQKCMRILSTKELSDRLVFSSQWKSEKEMYPCWSGTLCIYEAKDKPFGKTIEYEGLTAIIPKQFQGKSNMVILCNHPDFSLKENVFSLGKSAKAISMPRENGWYDTEPVFEFPTGEKKDRADNRRYLWRRDGSYIGLVARYYYYVGFDFYYCRYVLCDFRRGFRFGVFVVKGKIAKHKHIWETKCKICGVKK